MTHPLERRRPPLHTVLSRAATALNTGHPESAVRLLETVRGRGLPRRQRARKHYLLGQAFVRMGEFERAVPQFWIAVDLGHDCLRAWELILLCLLKLRRFDDALEVCDELERRVGGDAARTDACRELVAAWRRKLAARRERRRERGRRLDG
jgi:hypothetical protein